MAFFRLKEEEFTALVSAIKAHVKAHLSEAHIPEFILPFRNLDFSQAVNVAQFAQRTCKVPIDILREQGGSRNFVFDDRRLILCFGELKGALEHRDNLCAQVVTLPAHEIQSILQGILDALKPEEVRIFKAILPELLSYSQVGLICAKLETAGYRVTPSGRRVGRKFIFTPIRGSVHLEIRKPGPSAQPPAYEDVRLATALPQVQVSRAQETAPPQRAAK